MSQTKVYLAAVTRVQGGGPVTGKAPYSKEKKEAFNHFKKRVFFEAFSQSCPQEKSSLNKLRETFSKSESKFFDFIFKLSPQEKKSLKLCTQVTSLRDLNIIYSESSASTFWELLYEHAQGDETLPPFYKTIIQNELRRDPHEFSPDYVLRNKLDNLILKNNFTVENLAKGTINTLLEPRFWLASMGGFLVGRGLGSVLTRKTLGKPLNLVLGLSSRTSKGLLIRSSIFTSESLSAGLIWGLSAKDNQAKHIAQMSFANLSSSFLSLAASRFIPRLAHLDFKSALINQGIKSPITTLAFSSTWLASSRSNEEVQSLVAPKQNDEGELNEKQEEEEIRF